MKPFLLSARVAVLILALPGASADVTGRDSAAGTAPSLMQRANSPEAAAKAVVERYWSAEPRARYALLTKAYKLGLRRLGITNAAEYFAFTQPPERVWGGAHLSGSACHQRQARSAFCASDLTS